MTSPLYRQPAPPRREDDAHASVLRSRLEARLAQMRRLPEIQSTILLHLRARLDELAHDSAHTDAWRFQREQAIRAQAQKALDNAEEAAIEALEEVRRQAQEASTRDPGSIAEQQLLEAKIGNAWTNLRQYLESAAAERDPLAALEAVGERVSGDSVAVEALRRFGPNYVESRFTSQTKQTRVLIQHALSAAADRAEAPTFTPLQQAGRDILSDTERGMNRLQVNTRQTRREISGHGTAAALAEWTDGAAIRFQDQKGAFPAEAVTAAFSPETRAWAIQAQKGYPLLCTPAQPAKPDVLEQLGMRQSEQTFNW